MTTRRPDIITAVVFEMEIESDRVAVERHGRIQIGDDQDRRDEPSVRIHRTIIAPRARRYGRRVPRVFVTHNPENLAAYYGRALPELQAIESVEVVLNPLDRDLTTPELIEHAAGCEVIVAHRATPGDAALFDASPELVAFLRTAVDISTIDVAAATDNGVLVAHADKSFVPSTAEIALALLLDLARSVSESTIDYRRGDEPPQRPGAQLRGKTAGIVGYGVIARYLADVLRAMGLTVLVTDPYNDDATADGFEQTEFDDLLGPVRRRTAPRRVDARDRESDRRRRPCADAARALCSSMSRAASCSTRTRSPMRSTRATWAGWRWTWAGHPTSGHRRRSRAGPASWPPRTSAVSPRRTPTLRR